MTKDAPVPWSTALDPLVAYRTSSHPLASEISSRYDLQTINILKTKYGWPMDATDGLMKLGFRIVKLGLPEMFDDLKVLVATDEHLRPFINVHCAYELTRTGRIDNATAFVQSLTPEHCGECCERVLNIMAVSTFLITFYIVFNSKKMNVFLMTIIFIHDNFEY